jgi:hypothetical protein
MALLYVSHSQLDLWQHCPRKWEFRYIKKIQTPTSAPLLEGSAYHKVLETYFKERLEHNNILSLDDLYGAYEDIWKTTTAPSININWGDHEPGTVKEECKGLFTEYIVNYGSKIIPAKVEETYISNIDKTKFVCIIDLIDSADTVIDHKTSSKKFILEDTEKDIQATAEAFVLDKAIVFQHHVAIKGGYPQIQIVRSYRTQDDIKWWLEMARGIIAHMNTGICPPRAMKGDYLCSYKFCDYWKDCREGLAKVMR